MAKKNEVSTKSDSVTKRRSLSIKDVVVADPSIEFSLNLDPTEFVPTEDQVYLNNFEVQLSLSNLDPNDETIVTNIGRIFVNSLTQSNPYFYMSFGDLNYTAGTLFTLYMLFSAYDPTTGEPVDFEENPVKIEIIGGGISS